MACYKIAGPHYIYYAPFDATDAFPVTYYVGETGDEGIRSNRDVLTEQIVSDQKGKADIDCVYQGANLEIEFVAQDVNRQIVQAMLHPWQTDSSTFTVTGGQSEANDLSLGAGVNQEYFGNPGTLGCAVLGTLELIPITGTPAATFGAGSATSGTAGRLFKGISIGPIVENLDSMPRFVPVRFKCYPFLDGSTWKHWKWIAAQTTS